MFNLKRYGPLSSGIYLAIVALIRQVHPELADILEQPDFIAAIGFLIGAGLKIYKLIRKK